MFGLKDKSSQHALWHLLCVCLCVCHTLVHVGLLQWFLWTNVNQHLGLYWYVMVDFYLWSCSSFYKENLITDVFWKEIKKGFLPCAAKTSLILSRVTGRQASALAGNYHLFCFGVWSVWLSKREQGAALEQGKRRLGVV